MDCNGLQWYDMECNGMRQRAARSIWIAMECDRGLPGVWIAMDCNGMQWNATEGCQEYGLQWIAMDCNEMQWNAMECDRGLPGVWIAKP